MSPERGSARQGTEHTRDHHPGQFPATCQTCAAEARLIVEQGGTPGQRDPYASLPRIWFVMTAGVRTVCSDGRDAHATARQQSAGSESDVFVSGAQICRYRDGALVVPRRYQSPLGDALVSALADLGVAS